MHTVPSTYIVPQTLKGAINRIELGLEQCTIASPQAHKTINITFGPTRLRHESASSRHTPPSVSPLTSAEKNRAHPDRTRLFKSMLSNLYLGRIVKIEQLLFHTHHHRTVCFERSHSWDPTCQRAGAWALEELALIRILYTVYSCILLILLIPNFSVVASFTFCLSLRNSISYLHSCE